MRGGIINKRIKSLILVFIFLGVIINQHAVDSKSLDNSFSCYGFIIPFTLHENKTIENLIFCKTRHLVNDFLQEKIPVYWGASNFTANITDICFNNRIDNFFEKGTFIVPFTGNDTLDKKLLAIIYDYNQSSEIESKNEVKTPIYLINQTFTIKAYPLSELKIAQYQSLFAGGEEHYLEVSRNCGFLNFDFVPETKIKDKLNNSAYNIIIWAGSCIGYSSFHKGLSAGLYQINEDLNSKISKTIRSFVSNGGGYIGSCYGAYSASSGLYIGSLPIYLKRRAYNPNLNSLVILALSDVICKQVVNYTPKHIEAKIVDESHPVTFGLDDIVPDKYGGGPYFAYLGENAHVVARFHNFNDNFNGSASWISSNFGKGKVMIFSTHPESLCWAQDEKRLYVGNTIISNALYYLTSNEITDLNTINSRNISFILEVWEKTANLIDYTDTANVLNEIKISINDTIISINELNNNLSAILEIIEDINPDVPNNFLGYESTYWVIWYFNLYNTYLENTTKTLTIIELIYPLLENMTNFKQDLEILKDDLSERINETQNIIIECNTLCKGFKNILDRYNKTLKRLGKLGLNIYSYFAKNTAFKLYRESVKGFHYAPQTYFNSLKLLRHYWYDYELGLAKLI
ncbi:MAG: hypothetical protein QHH19_02910 [Candidatus Thermoplasmatota archaeon]|jgi:hypothetical protein|nr:hypothetical protein [Candidatus Thermoplasmatota archaeon]